MCKIAFTVDPSPGHGRSSDAPIDLKNDNESLGYYVDIREYEAQFGTTDGFPNDFYVIQITGLDKSLISRIFQPYMRPATALDPEWNNDPIDRYVYLGPERWQMGKQDRLPANLRNQLNRDGFLEFADSPAVRDQINSYVIDLVQQHGVAIGDVLINDPSSPTYWSYPPIDHA